jgi:hypothetical protein
MMALLYVKVQQLKQGNYPEHTMFFLATLQDNATLNKSTGQNVK